MLLSRSFPSTKKEPSYSEPLYLYIPEAEQPTFKMDWSCHGRSIDLISASPNWHLSVRTRCNPKDLICQRGWPDASLPVIEVF